MKLNIENWGEVQGSSIPVKLFTLENSQGLCLSVTNYGCIVTSLVTPDRYGKKADIVLGYESLAKYLKGHPFFGAIAGRYANRIKNGLYKLDDEAFQLETNELLTGQHLHGGTEGFDKKVWNFTLERKKESIFIHFNHISIHGESGYGGTLNVTHSIGLDELNQVHFNFKATTDKPTVINLANHSYYNLSGHDHETTDLHELKLFSQFYTPVDENSIPTGEILSVKQTGLNFTKPKLIGENKAQIPSAGFDHNFILDGTKAANGYQYAAELYDKKSGRMMTVLTTQPAVQFYNGFKLANKEWIGKHGKRYAACQGLCLETQHYPDSPNQAHFPTTRLNPNEIFEQKTLHRFSIK